MNSIDRATLIDFALGRLDDAEAAALANRAERDSEFAQTLAALRRELAALDGVRPAALRSLPLRSPSFAVETPDASETPRSPDADARERVLYLDSLNPNAVKVRRVGPVYPYYADETDKESENAQIAKNGQDATLGENEQIAKNGQDATFGENTQVAQSNENTTFSENAQLAKNSEDAAFDENEQLAKNSEDAAFDQNAQLTKNGKDAAFGENAQLAKNSQDAAFGEDAQIAKNDKDGVANDVRLTTPFRNRRFIPKFIATPRAPQRSSLVAKKARFLDDASPLADDPPQSAEFCDDANVESTRETGLESAAFVSNFDVSNEIQDNALNVVPLDDASQASLPPFDGASQTSETPPDDASQASVPPFDGAIQANEPPIVDAQDVPDAVLESGDYRDVDQENASDFNISRNKRRNATEIAPSAPVRSTEVARSDAECRLVELLGREPTQDEKEEYYWEPIDEEDDEIPPKQRRSPLGAPIRFATETTIAVGRTTLALCGIDRRAGLGSDAFAATKARRKRQPGKISDTMISTVSGFLIAVVVVWPLIRLVARDVLSTIAMSAVRKIGVGVPISENAPQSDVFPLISEHIVFPRYESGALQPLGDATPQETGARAETLAPAAPSNDDPASTPPTLEPVPVDANDAYNAPFDDAEKPPRAPRR